ncbi:probable ATP-dependent RNA helicase DDX52 [Copidosoma floridanum]|uniref:probable ATP-dependent RNA helicase DDX52 n=1 Tax=Copidosoma floridanum TaxID=29053 RepID=UPI0006C9560B|nr:probable ATP-dependent RNA helicase DDX52 [Copidosoma floridanum]
MMDTFDIFQMLSSGIRFDKEHFTNDAKKYQLEKRAITVKEEINAEIQNKDGNFFKKSVTKLKENVFKDNPIDILVNNHDREDKNKLSNRVEERSNLNKINNIHSNVPTLLGGIVAAEDSKNSRQKKKSKVTGDVLTQQERQKVNLCRDEHLVHVTGTRIPPPIEAFQQICVYHNVKSCIMQSIFRHYAAPTAIQMQAIPIMLQQRNLLACAPTGSGKTLAFLLPVIIQLKEHRELGLRAVILAPTRELVQQILREFLTLSDRCEFGVFHNASIGVTEKFGQKSWNTFDILISTPLRLLTLLRQESNPISLSRVEWLIIDEADKLFEEGNIAFKNQLEEILKACQNEKLRCAMFSATNPVDVTYWCRHNLRQLTTITIGQKNDAANTIKQELIFVGNEQGKLMQLRNIFQKGVSPPLLIFVQSKERAQELFKELVYDNVNVDVIHGDRTQTQRNNVVHCFREGKIWVLICTDLMSRGIDFEGVNLVINYDFPRSATSYIHRIGRTGRAGRQGKAITFFALQDIDYLRSIASVMRKSGCTVPNYMFSTKTLSKKKRRKIENIAPERQNTCTSSNFERCSKLRHH